MNVSTPIGYIYEKNKLDPYLILHTKINNKIKYKQSSSKIIEEIKVYIPQGRKGFSKHKA